MKKLTAFLLVITLVLSMGTTVFAWGPASGPANNNPGASQVEESNLDVRIGGNGNSARITVYFEGVAIFVSGRPANNVYNRLVLPGVFEGYVLGVFVRGNSILRTTVLERPAPAPQPEVRTGTRKVRTNRLPSLHVGNSEVEGSRALAGLNVSSTFVEVNFSHITDSAATGMGVLAGFAATGTLNYQYVRNYVKQWQDEFITFREYVWPNGDVVPCVNYEGRTTFGAVRDGSSYASAPLDGSREIEVISDNTARLVRGHGQGYLRSTVISGAFNVELYLANQRPTVNVTGYSYNINSL